MLKIHEAEMVNDGEFGLIAGCKCGWVCAGHLDDQTLAYAAIASHFLATAK